MEQEWRVLRRRHSEELKARVLEQCAVPGASVAKVVMTRGLNANMVHVWRKLEREQGGAVEPACPGSAAVPPRPVSDNLPQFVPVSMAQTPREPAPADIQIELRRGVTAMKITWPMAAAADCAAWMREPLR